MINDPITNHIKNRHINSFQKLRFLLYLDQHPQIKGTVQEFATWLYLGDTRLLEEIIIDLQRVGLVDYQENCCMLHNDPEIRLCLQCLAKAFEDPLTRQEVLDYVRLGTSFGHCERNVNEVHEQRVAEILLNT